MKLHRLRITPQQFFSVPADERALLIVVAHAINEINVLNKLLFLCSEFDREPKWKGHADVCQALIFVRALTGKLNEAWEVVQKGYFGKKLSLVYDHRLEEAAAEGLKSLKKYFGRTSVINIIRNNFAFHYSLENVSTILSEDVPADELLIYLAESNQNSLYHFAEYAMNKALLDAIVPSDTQKAIDQVLLETASVVRWFNDFSQGLLFAILDKYLDIELLCKGLEPLDIGKVALSTEIQIPFFFEVPRANQTDEEVT